MITNALITSNLKGALFGRNYSVAIGAPNQTAALLYGLIPPSLNAPLRVRFDIDKNPLGTSNKAKIEIFNMSNNSKQSIDKGYIVQLKAGYQGILNTLFIGNVLPDGIGSTRSGPDIITSLECGDGESSIATARLDKSYPAGTTALQILQDCASAMNVENNFNPDGTGSGIVFLPNNPVYNNGFSARGPVSDTLNKVLKRLGLEWSIQNGNLNVVPKTGHNGQQAVVVSVNTGMIGVPSNNGQVTKFTSLLNPSLIPGALVQLQSENTVLNGFYRIRRSHFEGDTHENKWQVDCECIKMNNVVQTFSNVNLIPTSTSAIA
jgi:hypothetical protein